MSDHILENMDTHYLSKKGRDKRQKLIYEQNHQSIIEILQKEFKGITRRELMRLTSIRSRRILRKHLSDMVLKEKIIEKNHLIFWNPNYERFKAWEKMVNNFTEHLTNSHIEVKKYLDSSVLIIVPQKIGDKIYYHTSWNTFQEMDSNAQKVWTNIRNGMNLLIWQLGRRNG